MPPTSQSKQSHPTKDPIVPGWKTTTGWKLRVDPFHRYDPTTLLGTFEVEHCDPWRCPVSVGSRTTSIATVFWMLCCFRVCRVLVDATTIVSQSFFDHARGRRPERTVPVKCLDLPEGPCFVARPQQRPRHAQMPWHAKTRCGPSTWQTTKSRTLQPWVEASSSSQSAVAGC